MCMRAMCNNEPIFAALLSLPRFHLCVPDGDATVCLCVRLMSHAPVASPAAVIHVFVCMTCPYARWTDTSTTATSPAAAATVVRSLVSFSSITTSSTLLLMKLNVAATSKMPHPINHTALLRGLPVRVCIACACVQIEACCSHGCTK